MPLISTATVKVFYFLCTSRILKVRAERKIERIIILKEIIFCVPSGGAPVIKDKKILKGKSFSGILGKTANFSEIMSPSSFFLKRARDSERKKYFERKIIFCVPSGGGSVIKDIFSERKIIFERENHFFLVPCTGRREVDNKRKILL